VISWLAPAVTWSKIIGSRTFLVRDFYDGAVSQAAKDCLFNKRTGIRRKVSSISINIHPPHSSQSQQIYHTIFDHLTTSIFNIAVYLDNNQTPRSSITKLTSFKTLTDKKFVDTYRLRRGNAPGADLTLKVDAQDFLKAVKCSQDGFITAYTRVFDMMASVKSIDATLRFSKDRPTRILAMTGLNWTSDSKNRNRDWEKVATAVVVESVLIASYREKLLKDCRPANLLRTELQNFFYKRTTPWTQISTKGNAPILVTDKRWIFADGIYVDVTDANDADDQTTLRSEWKAGASNKPSQKKGRSKKTQAAHTHAPDTAPGKGTTTTQKDAPTTAATKDNPPHKKLDDIQSILTSLKSLQKNKILQCSDPDAPSGNTESIVSFAASIIARVTLPYLSSPMDPPHDPFLRLRI